MRTARLLGHYKSRGVQATSWYNTAQIFIKISQARHGWWMAQRVAVGNWKPRRPAQLLNGMQRAARPSRCVRSHQAQRRELLQLLAVSGNRSVPICVIKLVWLPRRSLATQMKYFHYLILRRKSATKTSRTTRGSCDCVSVWPQTVYVMVQKEGCRWNRYTSGNEQFWFARGRHILSRTTEQKLKKLLDVVLFFSAEDREDFLQILLRCIRTKIWTSRRVLRVVKQLSTAF
jgi:hypothetical protein